MQQRVVPGDLNGVQASAYRASEVEEDEDDVQRTVGVGFRDRDVNSDRYSHSQRRFDQDQSETESRTGGGRVVPVYYVPGSSTVSSSNRHLSGTSSDHYEARATKPLVAGNYVSVRPGQAVVVPIRVAYNPIPVDNQQLHNTGSRSEFAAGSESSRVSSDNRQGYRIPYPPASTYVVSSSDRTRLESERESRVSSAQQTEKYTNTDLTNYNSYNSHLDSRYNNEDSQVQERVSPTTETNSRNAIVRGGGTTGVRVSAFPVHTIESSSLQRNANERDERRYTPSRPTYVTPSRVSEIEDSRSQYGSSSNRHVSSRVAGGESASRVYGGESASRVAGSDSSSQHSSTGSTYYVPSATSRSTLHSHNQYQGQQQGSASQTQYQAGGGSQSQHQAGSSQSQNQGYSSRAGGYTRPSYGSNTQQHGSAGSSSRFGSDARTGNSEDLLTYMTESERLARVQQQQIASAIRSSSALSSVDEANRRTINNAQHLDAAAAGFVHSNSNLANRLNSELDTVETLPGSGGFQRVKSWSKQSKWASGKS
jgi:hypothetical protein